MTRKQHVHSILRRIDRGFHVFVAGVLLCCGSSAIAASVPQDAVVTQLDGFHVVVSGGSLDGQGVATVAIVDKATGAVTKTLHLNVARSGHTTTVLPDGSLLVLGGIGADGKVLAVGEEYFKDATDFELLREIPVQARTGHTATVLTDGRLLIVGGKGVDGEVLSSAEVWDTQTGRVERVDIKLNTARFAHLASLLPNASVAISGGLDALNTPVPVAEMFDPATGGFSVISGDQLAAELASLHTVAGPNVTQTIPTDGAKDQPIDGLIAIRFNKPLIVSSDADSGFSLIGPNGTEAIDVAVAENGLLAFLTPKRDLTPGSNYAAFISGLKDASGNTIPLTAFSFKTKGLSPSGNTRYATSRNADPEMWIPSAATIGHAWVTGLPPIPVERAAPKKLQKAAVGETVLTGRVLRMNGQPLAGVTLSIGAVTAVSDQDGDFLLNTLPQGTQVLKIDGTTANRDDVTYGLYLYRAELAEGSNVLPFPIWMQKLDPLGDREISSPLDHEIALINPAIPGLEVRLPAGTVLRDLNGKVVTHVNLTPIPTDRPPFPLTTGDIPTYFTLQPGGARITNIDPAVPTGAQVVYPNYYGMKPGAQGDFWNYDPRDRGWYVYGHGHVAADGMQVFPDPGVAIYEFTGAMFGNAGVGPHLPSDPSPGDPGPAPCAGASCCPGNPSGPPGGGGGGGGGGGWSNTPSSPAPGCDRGGDPVSLSTGQFTHFERDLYLPDVIPIDLTRRYRSLDTVVRSFGVGMSDLYDVSLWNTSTSGYADFYLILPDGGRVHFTCTTSCTTYADAAYETLDGGEFYMSTLTRVNAQGGWILLKPDGTRWFFPSFAPLKTITDIHGNVLTITRRDDNGNNGPITRISSPNGRSVDFTIDSNGRITAATDNAGRTVTYTYDSTDSRLMTVIDPSGGQHRYEWDAAGTRLVSVYDPKGNRFVYNQSDTSGRVTQQTLADSSTYGYAYTPSTGQITKTDMTDRSGRIREVTFNTQGQVVSDAYPLGLPEQQTTTFEYTNGLQTAVVDPRGKRTETTYDARGNVATTTLAAGTPDAITTSYTWTASGPVRLLSIDGPMAGSGDTTTFTYDSNSQLLRITDPNGAYERYEYDAQGRITLFANALEQQTTYTYDGADLATITNPMGQTTTFISDGVGRVVTVIDPLGGTTREEFDALNRATAITDEEGGQRRFSYDAAGNLSTYEDERGNVTSFSVNSQGVVYSRTDPLNKTDSKLFNGDGTMKIFQDRLGLASGLTYDNRGRISTIGYGANTSSPTAYQNSISYQYVPGTDLFQQITDSLGGTVNYQYDALDRMAQQTSSYGTIGYTYNPDGSRSSMTVTGQAPVNYAYDVGGRLRQIQQGTASITFDYDLGNRKTKATLANGIEVNFGRDANGNVTSITYVQGGVTLGDLRYTYDAASHRTSIGGSLANTTLPSAVQPAIYDAGNRLTQWDGQTFTYDDNGNLLSDGARTYTWNSRNQLDSIAGAASASFQYDSLGRRSQKLINGSQDQFLYDGLDFVQELVGGVPTATILTEGLDSVLLRSTTSPATSMTPLLDASGNVVALTDSSGNTQVSYGYEPYGKSSQIGSDTNSQKFGGREDDGTGLFYYRARYYLAGCGRFISEDPMGLMMGSNLYAYAGGDPIDFGDPLGLSKTCHGTTVMSAVDDVQATGTGALGIAPTVNQVGISPRTFGLPYPEGAAGNSKKGLKIRAATQKEIMAHMDEIVVHAPGVADYATGFKPDFKIADIGDKNVRMAPKPRMDLYRFATNDDAVRFGKQEIGVTITGVPDKWPMTGYMCK
jgi:RHS repeat-associated protein